MIASHFYSGSRDFKAVIPANKAFKQHHSYDVLKKCEKWKTMFSAQEKKKEEAKGKGKRVAAQDVDDSGDEVDPSTAGSSSYHLGTKKAKLAVQKKKESENIRESIRISQQEAVKAEKAKVAAMERTALAMEKAAAAAADTAAAKAAAVATAAAQFELELMMKAGEDPKFRGMRDEYLLLRQEAVLEKMRFEKEKRRREKEALEEAIEPPSRSASRFPSCTL